MDGPNRFRPMTNGQAFAPKERVLAYSMMQYIVAVPL